MNLIKKIEKITLREKSISYKKYLEVIRPNYIYFKITPHKSIRNYNSSNIAKAIANTHKSLYKRIRREQKKLWIETNFKVSYVIDITKTDISFYFIVPESFKGILKEKMHEIWQKATIEEVTSIPGYSEDVLKYSLNLKYEDALSLDVNKKSNEPLNSILSVVDIMQDKDRVSVIYNFIPTSQNFWEEKWNSTIQRYNDYKIIDKDKNSSSYMLKTTASFIMLLLDSFRLALIDFMSKDKDEKSQESIIQIIGKCLTNRREVSQSTKKKKYSLIIENEILVLSESDDSTRKYNNAISTCQSFNTIEEDNNLIYKPISKKGSIDLEKYTLTNSRNTLSVDECQNFIQIPGRELLESHSINHINTTETTVPVELQEGDKCIGDVICKGNSKKLHLTTDKDFKNLAVAVVGPTRSGKTSLLGNIARDSIDNEECVIVLDYIENCGLSEDIKKCIPQDKILELNLQDYKNLQGLGYNEAIKDTTEPFELYESAKQQASQVIALVNSVNIENSEFTPKMKRFLDAACLVAFVSKGAVKDVIDILKQHDVRYKYCKAVPQMLSEFMDEYVETLLELNEYDKDGNIIGTRSSSITGVIDRFSSLKSNTYMELMMKKGIENNFNLYEEMEKNQCIFIKMPEIMFQTADERDAMVTYWLTKIWLSGQVRAWNIKDKYKRKTVTVITDELAQLKASEEFVGKKLDQTAKFAIKFVISTMYINQLRIKEKLKTANTSYIFIAGADKNNFKEMKEEFEVHGFDLEDMQRLKRYHALNYLMYEGGSWAGISKLPKPIS